MSSRTVYPARRVVGTVSFPGDKSISHRAAMIGAISQGTSRVFNYAHGADCQSTLRCLQELGIHIERLGDTLQIRGAGPGGLRPPTGILDAGNSGTTVRLLSGILAGQPFETTISGDASLQRRPMQRIIEPLTQMGAQVTAGGQGTVPLVIRGGALKPIFYALPVASAQVKSCLLLASLHATGTTRIEEPTPTRNHTEIMLRQFGAKVEVRDRSIAVTGPASLTGRDVHVPGDISSAAFFIAAALTLPDSFIRLQDVGVNPTRTGFINLLRRFGAQLDLKNEREWQGEPVADIIVRSSQLKNMGSSLVAGETVPAIIDEIPILAILATQMEGGLTIRDAGELRVKESDRIGSLVKNLERMGVEVEEYQDGLRIPGPQPLHCAVVDSYGDHRIAMAFAVAGLLAQGQTELEASESVEVSFPEFFPTLEQLVER